MGIMRREREKEASLYQLRNTIPTRNPISLKLAISGQLLLLLLLRLPRLFDSILFHQFSLPFSVLITSSIWLLTDYHQSASSLLIWIRFSINLELVCDRSLNCLILESESHFYQSLLSLQCFTSD